MNHGMNHVISHQLYPDIAHNTHGIAHASLAHRSKARFEDLTEITVFREHQPHRIN